MLRGEIKPINEYTENDIRAMYLLMAEFYDGTDEAVFRRDFADKDYCLTLYGDKGEIVGFTTQKILELDINGKPVHGVFSGDTIIHRDYWGETELFKVWARFWFSYGEKYGEFYWFLICKGYKTYRIMPTFWREFYPNHKTPTPAYEKSIIDGYASLLYPEEYNSASGVIEYKHNKDRLRGGVADVGEREMRNRDIAFFCEKNPGYIKGNDIACLARIDRAFLKKRAAGLLFDERSV